MNRMKKSVEAKNKALKKQNALYRKTPVQNIPEFTPAGTTPEIPKKKHTKLAITLLVLLGFSGTIYGPSLLFKQEPPENSYYIAPDFSAIRKTNDNTRDNPDGDFDADGLLNHQELQYGTSARRQDSDGDGISDYAEIHITDTNPTVPDAELLQKLTAQAAEDEGLSVRSPYKTHEVVLWPSDMKSRAYGGVVRTLNGYRFCNFQGWAQFPVDGYAYKLADGRYIPLEHKEHENAWKIDDDYEVVVYKKPLQYKNQLAVFGLGGCSVPDNLFGKALSALLPDDIGLLTCKRIATLETAPNAAQEKVVPLVVPDWDSKNTTRFGENHNTLDDLAGVYRIIDEGAPVLVSLNSANDGEVVSLIYGYNARGDLLAADISTLKPAGILRIEPRAARMMDANGEFTQSEWYEFAGCGFDSRRLDRIHFISAGVS